MNNTSMPSSVFIFHGAYGHPEENWFPWLKTELETKSYQVFVPHFPTPKGQTLKNWQDVWQQYSYTVDTQTIFVGHSLGVAFALRLLEKLQFSIAATFCIAGCIEPIDPKFQVDSFVDTPFQWEKIRENCQKFIVYHSDNDPYLDRIMGEKLAKSLHVPLELRKNAGHFNSAEGYTKFTELLETIRLVR